MLKKKLLLANLFLVSFLSFAETEKKKNNTNVVEQEATTVSTAGESILESKYLFVGLEWLV